MTCIITPHTPRHHPGCACHEARRDAELAAARAALLALAPRCHFCDGRPATRCFDGVRACDGDACVHEVRCVRCDMRDDDQPLDAWRCPWCGCEQGERVLRLGAWRDLPHAEAIRAAEAAR